MITDLSPTAAAAPAAIGAGTGTLLIVANMIGVGVFVSTGFMVEAMPSPAAILAAWAVGGLAAMCGALSYAELGAAISRNGGEYQLLSRIYHPAVGFVGGVVSEVVGFAAPLAAYALAFEKYLGLVVPGLPPFVAGGLLIVLFSVLHSLHVGTGNRLHNAFTLGKLALIAVFIAAGLLWGDVSRLSEDSATGFGTAVRSPAFAVQLVYVSFAYSGWNAAAYLAGEFRRPDRDILRAVVAGTTVVALLYLGLNAMFLAAAPLDELAGHLEVAHVVGERLFGTVGGDLVALLIAAGLISSISGNLMSGSRVFEAMGVDWPVLRGLATRRAEGGPVVAISLQAAIALALMLSVDVEGLLQYVGVTLSLCAAATVLGVVVLRIREPNLPRPYRTWGYPMTPVIFVLLQGWMIVFALQSNPGTAAAAVATLGLALGTYFVVRWMQRRRDAVPHDRTRSCDSDRQH